MNSGRTIFVQLLDFLPKHKFNRDVQRYRGHHRLRRFSCFDQFLAMAGCKPGVAIRSTR